MPSASSLPMVTVASPPAPPPAAAMTSQMVSAMDQGNHLIAILQQDVSNAWKMIDRTIAREAAYVWQQWEQLAGNIFHFPNPSLGSAVPQPGSGSGSGSGAMTTAHNAQNQQLKTAIQQVGSGAGSGAATTAHENASTKRVRSLLGSGSGSGSGSATVSGEVWLDNNGDGSLDDGELGFSGIPVYLDDQYGNQLMSTTTDANGNYSFNVNSSLLNQGSGCGTGSGNNFEIQVAIPNGDEATTQGADSQIDANGFSPVFALAAGGNEDIQAGIRSTVVTTTQDDFYDPIQNQVTLRDAIETVINGLNQPVTFQAGLNGIISLQAALPDLSTNITITGPGSSSLTVQGNGGTSSPLTGQANADAANPFRIFTVNAGVTATIIGLELTDGLVQNDDGGGILNNGNLTLINCDVYNNQATNAGVVGLGLGGGIFNDGINAQLTLEGTSVDSNTAAGAGGGIYNNGGYVAIIGGFVYLNDASSGGGGIYNNGGQVSAWNGAKITNNTDTGSWGGGVYNNNSLFMNSLFTMVGGRISNNKELGSGGGGVFNAGTMTLSNVSVRGNQAKTQGGGLYVNGGKLSLYDVIVGGAPGLFGNKAAAGGGMYIQGRTVGMSKGVILGNSATGPQDEWR